MEQVYSSSREYRLRIMDPEGRILSIKGQAKPGFRLGTTACYRWAMFSNLWFEDKQSAQAFLREFPEIAAAGGRVVREVGGEFEPA